MGEHATLSASGAHRWMACPGSVALEATLPETTSPYAEEGTLAHTLAAAALVENFNPTDLPPHDPEAPAEGLNAYPPEMREAVQAYVDFVRALGVQGETLVECRVSYDDTVPGGFGTVDALVLRDGVAEVVDLKYGAGVPVHAHENPQLLLYALGAAQDHGYLYGIETWRLTVHQPRMEVVDTWEVPAVELETTWRVRFQAAATRALASDAPFAPGLETCRWCRARAVCKARAEYVLAVAQQDFAEPPPEPVAPGALTVEQLAAILHRLPQLTRWIADVQEHARTLLRQGQPLPGWKLVEGRANRKWTDQEAAEAVLKALGLGVKQLYPRRLIGIPEAEKLVRARPGSEKVRTKRLARLAECVTRPPGKPVLAPADDPRNEIGSAAAAAEDFADPV